MALPRSTRNGRPYLDFGWAWDPWSRRTRPWYFIDMQSSIVFNVVQRNEQWHVLKDGADEPLGRYHDKIDAVDRARDLAQREESAILRITAVGGSIQSELVYGSDPIAMEGTLSAG